MLSEIGDSSDVEAWSGQAVDVLPPPFPSPILLSSISFFIHYNNPFSQRHDCQANIAHMLE